MGQSDISSGRALAALSVGLGVVQLEPQTVPNGQFSVDQAKEAPCVPGGPGSGEEGRPLLHPSGELSDHRHRADGHGHSEHLQRAAT